MSKTERSATTTTDHDEIRKWVEKRGGHPAIVKDTADNGRRGAMIRIDFDDPDGSKDAGLKRVGWDEFFEIFDNNDLAFLHQDVDDSRFNKLVQRQTADAD
jgi:hypothetical protein